MSGHRGDREDFYAGEPRPRRRDERREYGPPGGRYEYDERERPRVRREGGGRGGDEDAAYGRGVHYREDFYAGPPRADERDFERERRYDGPRHDEGARPYMGERYYEDARHYEGERRYEGGRRAARRGATRSHLRCRDIMTRDVTVAARATTLEEVARMMRDEDTGVIPIVESPVAADAAEKIEAGEPVVVRRGRADYAAGNGRLVGLITDRDIVIRAIAEGLDARQVRAEELMTKDLHAVRPNDRVIEAIRKMGDKQVRRLPVVDREGNLRGIISMADIALETGADRELGEALEEISSGSSFWNRIFG
jgi:CBS domain-containing protein